MTTYLAFYLPFSSFIAMLLSIKWRETDSETLKGHSPAHLYLDLISINARRLRSKQEWEPRFPNCNRFQVFIPQLLAWESLACSSFPRFHWLYALHVHIQASEAEKDCFRHQLSNKIRLLHLLQEEALEQERQMQKQRQEMAEKEKELEGLQSFLDSLDPKEPRQVTVYIFPF